MPGTGLTSGKDNGVGVEPGVTDFARLPEAVFRGVAGESTIAARSGVASSPSPCAAKWITRNSASGCDFRAASDASAPCKTTPFPPKAALASLTSSRLNGSGVKLSTADIRNTSRCWGCGSSIGYLGTKRYTEKFLRCTGLLLSLEGGKDRCRWHRRNRETFNQIGAIFVLQCFKGKQVQASVRHYDKRIPRPLQYRTEQNGIEWLCPTRSFLLNLTPAR